MKYLAAQSARILRAAISDAVISSTAAAFLLRGVGALLAFVLNVFVTRLLGIHDAGIYFLSLSIIMIASVVGRVGLDNVILRFVSMHSAEEDWGRVLGVFRTSFYIVIGSTGALAVFFVIFAPWLSVHFFEKPDLAHSLQIMSAAIIFFSLMNFYSEGLKGLKHVRDSMLVSGVLYPIFAIGVLWPAVKIFGLEGAALAYVVGVGLATLFGTIMWRRAVGVKIDTAPVFSFETLAGSAKPLFVMSVLNRAILPWAPLLMIGYWGTNAEAAILGTTLRIASLVTFFLVSVTTVMAPIFAQLYANKQINKLEDMAKKASLLVTIGSLPMFVFLIFYSETAMSMFGAEFTQGSVVLRIIAIAQLLNAVTGPIGVLLIMSGREVAMMRVAMLCSFLVLVLGVILTPLYGSVGTAVAYAVAVGMGNLYSLFFVIKELKLNPLPFALR